MALAMISMKDWYRRQVDTGKNRVHLKIIGRWDDVNDELTGLQFDAIASRTRSPKKNFYIKHEALLWLDEVGRHSAIDSRTVAGSPASNIYKPAYP